MNDELFLKQLEQIIPQEDSERRIYASDTRQQFQKQAAPSQAADRTRPIVWELPAEPRFQVMRGGMKGDWKWLRPLAGNLTFLTLFILALVYWPHTRPHAVATAAMPSSLSSLEPQTTAAASNLSRPVRASTYPVTFGRANTPFASSAPNAALQTSPPLYAAKTARGYAPARSLNPSYAGSYHVTSYRVAPAAPLTGSMPPMQSPY